MNNKSIEKSMKKILISLDKNIRRRTPHFDFFGPPNLINKNATTGIESMNNNNVKLDLKKI
jgi:hypothetical protein